MSGSSGGGRRIAYLSGAPRIATRSTSEVSGPRSHIVGFLDALREGGHDVAEFIVGDRMPASVTGSGSLDRMRGGAVRQVAIDAARVGMRYRFAREAIRTLGSSFDLVYERSALFQELGRPFRRAGVPWVVETNAVLFEEARHERQSLVLQRLAERFERGTYRDCDLVVCVTPHLASLLETVAGVDPAKVVVVPNGVDTERFRPPPEPPPRVFPGFTIGFVGFVIARQGLDDLLRAIAGATASGVDVSLSVVGDGPALPELRQLAEALDLTDRVAFHGQVPWEEVPARLAAVDVGFSGQKPVGADVMYHSPLKIYEYLAMGRPVLASANEDARAVISPARAGWLFEVGDADQLLAAVVEAAGSSDETRAEMGARGRAAVVGAHTWRQRVDGLLDEIDRRGLT